MGMGTPVNPSTRQAFPDMYGNPYGQQMNPYAMQPMNQFSGPSFNQMGGYGPTFANMTGYGNFGGAYQQPQMPQRYSNDYNRFLQSGQSFNEPVMGYNTYGQIFAPPRQQPPSFGKGGGGFRPQPPAMGGKGGGMSDMQYRGPQQPPVMGGKGQPQNQGPFMSYPGGSGYTNRRQRPERRTRQLGLNNEPGRPAPPDVQVTPPPPQIADGVPQSFLDFSPQPNLDFYNRQNNADSVRAYPGDFQSVVLPGRQPVGAIGTYSPTDGPGSTSPNLDFYNRQNNLGSVRAYPTNQQSITMPGQGPVAATGGVPQDNIYNPAYQQQMAFQQGNSEEATRNRIQKELNDAFTTGKRSGKPLLDLAEQQDELSNKLYGQYGLNPVRATTLQGSGGGLGLGGMPTGASQTGAQNRFAISTGDSRYNPETGTYGPSNTVYFDQSPAPDNYIPRFGNMGFFQEGGQVPPDAATNMEMMLSEAGPANPQAEMSGEYDRLIQMTMQAVLGQVEQPDEIIQMFIDEFGVDAFRQLRDAVLKQQVPNAQTEGMVDGNGGGMDDQVMGMIGAQRPVAVSPGEYIIPADVVSGLGDGSSKSGADILDELSQAVRMTRTGTTEQPRPLMETLSQ